LNYLNKYSQKLDLSSSPWLFPLNLVHFYLWKHTKQWTFRELFIVRQSPLDAWISFLGDLYWNSYVWLYQSTKIWAIVCKTTILGPIWVRNVPKTQRMDCDFPFWAQIESIKSTGERSRKVEFKTWQGQILKNYFMSVWSSVSGHSWFDFFHDHHSPRKQKCTRQHVTTWITFWLWLGPGPWQTVW